MIQLQQVSKTFKTGQGKVAALENINLAIKQGEFVVMTGPSGSGKSTLLSLIGLLVAPSEGTLRIGPHETSRLNERDKTELRNQKIGFVFQFPGLVNTLTARENVLLPKLFNGKLTAEDGRRADELLAEVGLSDKSDRRPHELSGGEQRRVTLARALINDPDLILADEPTGALDKGNSYRIMELFLRFHRAGKTIFMVTHDPELIAYGNRRLELQNGRIRYDNRAESTNGTIAPTI
ncbi:ABC transporter ATP-binding protein [Effusibacillus dendaii]|uniref:Macrolide ABC transporter ATP-binding protein n=1 Tax=Effusibacillus dendaii TaxID=2743772 RepID=A0A7I8D7S7_9BACL|nr:ABC transporter ATP-binding protein [Effusibacillus dendaii]BCJ85059.1 macrolide ABC transporter ATP-binding protein [Effusibacillus dendaii]